MITEEDKMNRIDVCMNCEYNSTDVVPTCNKNSKSISFLTSEENESCPEEKW